MSPGSMCMDLSRPLFPQETDIVPPPRDDFCVSLHHSGHTMCLLTAYARDYRLCEVLS